MFFDAGRYITWANGRRLGPGNGSVLDPDSARSIFPVQEAVRRIRDVYPGSQIRILLSRIQEQNDSGSRIRICIKEL